MLVIHIQIPASFMILVIILVSKASVNCNNSDDKMSKYRGLLVISQFKISSMTSLHLDLRVILINTRDFLASDDVILRDATFEYAVCSIQ